MTKQSIIRKRIFVGTLTLLLTGNAFAQQESGTSVFTNTFKDNWEVSVGVEHLSFYSGREEGLKQVISKSPFEAKRSSFGVAVAVNKWFTPEYGIRTKAHGYWGKAVSQLNENEDGHMIDDQINFFSIQEHFLFNASNVILGYDPMRRWAVIPYVGLAINRNVTHRETSYGVGFGIRGR